jgi:hypothetical protein
MEPLTLVVTVRCLSCGVSYPKPEGGGTVKTNPGCPECGYLGWVHEAGGVTPAAERHRFAVGPRRLHSGLQG